MKIRLYNIGWNIDSDTTEDFNLPSENIINDPNKTLIEAAKKTLQNHEAAEELEDYLSDKYGFPVYEFGVEIIE